MRKDVPWSVFPPSARINPLRSTARCFSCMVSSRRKLRNGCKNPFSKNETSVFKGKFNQIILLSQWDQHPFKLGKHFDSCLLMKSQNSRFCVVTLPLNLAPSKTK